MKASSNHWITPTEERSVTLGYIAFIINCKSFEIVAKTHHVVLVCNVRINQSPVVFKVI